MESRGSVLIIEDDRDLVNLLTLHLRDLGFAVEHASDGRRGLGKAREGKWSLIILDLMLPGMDGLEICRRVRAESGYTPILMLTAKSDEIDKVLGLEVGADDYLTKPFSVRELLARVKAITRRIEGQAAVPAAEDAPLQLGSLVVDRRNRRVSVEGRVVELTQKEYELLELFVLNPGRAFSRDQLLDRVWGYRYEGYGHTVNSHINRLRSKIEPDPAHPTYIQTVWGFGYRFTEAP